MTKDKVQVNYRIHRSAFELLKETAEALGVSNNALVEKLIERYLAHAVEDISNEREGSAEKARQTLKRLRSKSEKEPANSK
jgi:hypothetical protein